VETGPSRASSRSTRVEQRLERLPAGSDAVCPQGAMGDATEAVRTPENLEAAFFFPRGGSSASRRADQARKQIPDHTSTVVLGASRRRPCALP